MAQGNRKFSFSDLPRRVQREISAANTPRAKLLKHMLDTDNSHANIRDTLREKFPEFNWEQLGKGDVEPTLPEAAAAAPELAPPAEPEPAPLPLPDLLPAPLVERPLPNHGVNQAMQAIEPFLDEQRRVPDQRLAGVCEAVYRATLAYNQMRRWLPINTLDFLVSRGYVSGDPDYLDRTYIAYADGTRLRQARLARGFTADHLADLATMLGATLSLSTLLRAENNNLPLFGDRLTALALALGVPEECLTREGPELPDPLPPLDEQGLVRAALPAPTPEVKPATKEEASMPVPNQDEIRRDETQRTQEDKPPTLFARLRQEANGEELRLSQIMRLWVQQVHEMEEELDAARNTNVQAELETAEVALRELRLQLEQVQQENRRLTGLYGRQKIVIDNQRATLQRLEEQLITGDGAEPHAEATPAPGR